MGDQVKRIYYSIATWGFEISHVAIFYSPRGRETFPPKFHSIPPKFYFAPTWRMFYLYVEIYDFPRGDQLFLRQKRIGSREAPLITCQDCPSLVAPQNRSWVAYLHDS